MIIKKLKKVEIYQEKEIKRLMNPKTTQLTMGSQAEKIKMLKEKRSKLENKIDREKDAYKKCLE